MSSQHSDASRGGGRGGGGGPGGPGGSGGRGSGPEAGRAPGLMAASAQTPAPASTTGSSTMSEWRTVSYLPSSTLSHLSTPDADDSWSSRGPPQVTTASGERPDADPHPGLRGVQAYDQRIWTSSSDTDSNTSEGVAPDSLPVTATEPPKPSSTPKTVSLQEPTQPSMGSVFRESELSTSPEPSSTSEISIRGYPHRASFPFVQDSVLIPPAPNNTPQGSSQESLPSLVARAAPVAVQRPIQFLGPSLASIQGSPLHSAASTERSSVQEEEAASSQSSLDAQRGSPAASMLSTARSSAQERLMSMNSSMVANQGSHPASLLSTPRSWSQETVTVYGSSRGLAPESRQSPESRPFRHSGPQPPPVDSSQVLARMATQCALAGTSRMPVEASGPSRDCRGVSVQVCAPPYGRDPDWLSVDELAPPLSPGREWVEEPSPPWASLSPWETVNQSMASREKASGSGHMFDVVVIGGGISGQCEPQRQPEGPWLPGEEGVFCSALAFGGERGVSCVHWRGQQWLPQTQQSRTGGCARFGGGANWEKLAQSFVAAIQY